MLTRSFADALVEVDLLITVDTAMAPGPRGPYWRGALRAGDPDARRARFREAFCVRGGSASIIQILAVGGGNDRALGPMSVAPGLSMRPNSRADSHGETAPAFVTSEREE
jgi:hypothetical protein